MVQFLLVSVAGLSLQSILWAVMDLILVTFGDMELIFKPELSHFRIPTYQGENLFPLK